MVQVQLGRMTDRVVILRMGRRVDLVEAVSLVGVVAEVGIVGDGVGLEGTVGAAGVVADMFEQIVAAEVALSGIPKGRELAGVDIVGTVAAALAVKEQAESTCFPAARSSRSSVI